MKVPQRIAGLATALTLIVTLASCSSSTDAGSSSDSRERPGITTTEWANEAFERNAPVYGGSLVFGLEAPVENLDPGRAESAASLAVYGAIYGRLFDFLPSGEISPNMAKSISSDEDGKVWTIELRDGIQFSDGTPYDADAVIAHWERIGAEGSASRSAGEVRALESLVAVGPLQIVATLKSPSLVWPQAIITNPGSMNFVPSPTNVANLGDQAGLKPVGAGAFTVTSFVPGGDIALAKNENYFDKDLPYLDGLTYTPSTDTDSRISALIAGDVDLAAVTSAQLRERGEENGLLGVRHGSTTYYDLLFNLNKAPFDDVRFRKAVIQAIDRDALNAAVFGGKHEVMNGMFTPDHPFHHDTEWPGFDPKAAEKLVKEWSKDTGLAPEFELTTTSPPDFQKQAALIQQMLEDVGIKMTISISDAPGMTTTARSGDYTAQFRLMGVSFAASQDLRVNLHSTSPGNLSHAGDPELDELLDQLPSTTTDGYGSLYADIQERLAVWLPRASLVRLDYAHLVGDKVGGFPGVQPNNFVDVRYLYVSE